MDYLVFSSDGVLRVKINNEKPSLPLSFIKEQSKNSELRFMSYWLNQKAIFEHGLTIGSFLNCLQPFQDYLDDYLLKEISAYIKESKKPIAVEKRIDFDWVTLFHHSTISGQNETVKEGSIKQTILSNRWKLYNSYMLCAYKKNLNEHFSIDQYPIQKIQHLPLFLDKHSRLIINQKEISNIDKNQYLINNQGFGLITQNIDGYSIDYLLIEKEYTLNDIIQGFFKFFNKTIENREIEKELLENFENELEEEETETVKLKIHGGILNQAIMEEEEKNQTWNDLVKLASKKQYIIKIGKINEGSLPETKLFGYSVNEELKNLKIK